MRQKFLLTLIVILFTFNNLWAQAPPQGTPVMTLNVTQGSTINFNLLGAAENTEVWIETSTGNYSYITVGAGQNWSALSYKIDDDVMRIYGNVEAIECKNNGSKVTGFDASQNPYMRTLWCNENRITELKVNSGIVSLMAMGNQISELDVTNCPDLSLLYCERNNLQKLDIHANPYLEHLSISENQISRLDVSNNPLLYGVSIFGNDFEACALDSLYESLADRNGDFSGTLYVKNSQLTNPGVDGSKTDVAYAKYWEVQDYNKQNPFNIYGNGLGCETQSVEDQQVISFSVIPNPVVDEVMIEIPEMNQDKNLVIYDITGKIVFQQILTENNTVLSMDCLEKGIYVIKIGKDTRKIIKN